MRDSRAKSFGVIPAGLDTSGNFLHKENIRPRLRLVDDLDGEQVEIGEMSEDVSREKGNAMTGLRDRDVERIVQALCRLDQYFVGKEDTVLVQNKEDLRLKIEDLFTRLKRAENRSNYNEGLKLDMAEGRVTIQLAENKMRNTGAAQMFLFEGGNHAVFAGTNTLLDK